MDRTVPEGYRKLRVGETVVKQDKMWSVVEKQWIETQVYSFQISSYCDMIFIRHHDICDVSDRLIG